MLRFTYKLFIQFFLMKVVGGVLRMVKIRYLDYLFEVGDKVGIIVIGAK